MKKANLKNILTAVRDIINRSSGAVIRKAQSAEKQANNAQATANNAQATINGSLILVQQEFSFDKETAERDSFVYKTFNYYKISEFAPSKERVVSFVGTNEYGDSRSIITHGTGCDAYGAFIVVTSTKNPALPGIDIESFVEISPPSTGLYALFEVGNSNTTAGTAKFTLTPGQAIVLASSTLSSTKKFKITVDDNGTLSATEVTS